MSPPPDEPASRGPRSMVDVPATAVVVLDIDDTLYLERSYVRSGFEAVGRYLADEFGVSGVAETLWQGFEAGVRGDAFDRALTRHDIEPGPDLVTDLVTRYRCHRPAIELLPDAARLLDRLGDRLVAAITDGPAEAQRAKIDALGLPGRLSPIVVTGERGPGWSKPNSAPYELVEQELSVEARHCWYIADNPTKDFVTPLQRDWTAVRIRRPGSLHQVTASPPGCHEIYDLDQLDC